MNSISHQSQHHFQRQRIHDISKTYEQGLSKAKGSLTTSENLNRACVNIDFPLKSEIMFNRSTKSGSNGGGMSEEINMNENSSFKWHSASNDVLQRFANSPALVHGAAGLIAASSQTPQHQQNRSTFAAQTHALARHRQQQQQHLYQMTKNEFEVQQMATNIKESLIIKQRLESIKYLQQQETNKIRAELQMKAAGIIGRNSPSSSSSSHLLVPNVTKSIPSTSNCSVFPTKQREDEMTKPDLSTLAETAVAVASASTGNSAQSRSSGILGIRNIIMTNSRNGGNNQITSLFGRQDSSSQFSKKILTSKGPSISQSIPTSITNSLSNNAMTDALRRDITATRNKLHLEHSYKRSLDKMTKSSSSTSSSSSWLLKSNPLGNSTSISMDRVRAHNEHLQRRNSLPTPGSVVTSEFESLRSLKRRRLLEQKANEIGELEVNQEMHQMRQLDAKMKMQITNNSSLLAKMASKIASQERRSSLASSIASAGTSATAPNLTTHSSFSSPVDRAQRIVDERSMALMKLSKMGGGFPMPKFRENFSNPDNCISTASGGMKCKIPAEITPELGRDIVDITGRETSSLSLEQQLSKDQQSIYLQRIGGFPMPPLYRHNDENNDRKNEGAMMVQGQYDGSSRNNAISSHIRKNVNCGGTNASRPPTLESYKRVWHDICVVTGDDPRGDELLRKEVFARKLQRGGILVGMDGKSIANNINNRNMKNHLPL